MIDEKKSIDEGKLKDLSLGAQELLKHIIKGDLEEASKNRRIDFEKALDSLSNSGLIKLELKVKK